MILFLDSSSSLKLGLIDNNKFIFFKDYKDFKSSASIHKYVYDALLNFNTDISTLDAVITIAGPGSYTGIRVTYGFAQILKYLGIPHYNTYHFEIPKLLGISSGTWYSYAYKKEIFVYSWDDQSSKTELISQNEFTPDIDFFDASSNSQSQNTLLLLISNIEKILLVLKSENIHRSLIYYRQVEDEFKSQKRTAFGI